jgi:hypothetical protein
MLNDLVLKEQQHRSIASPSPTLSYDANWLDFLSGNTVDSRAHDHISGLEGDTVFDMLDLEAGGYISSLGGRARGLTSPLRSPLGGSGRKGGDGESHGEAYLSFPGGGVSSSSGSSISGRKGIGPGEAEIKHLEAGL